MATITRLSPADLTNLAVEAGDNPMHQAAFGVLEGGELLDGAGRVRIDAIRAHVEARLGRAPELRQKLQRGGLLRGAPSWGEDPEFKIEDHVHVIRMAEPGEVCAMAFAEKQMATLMDRSRPLWEMWFLEGYAPGQIGLLLKLHHALADGPAMINLVAQIFDLKPLPLEVLSERWRPSPPATARALMRDNLRRKLQRLTHPREPRSGRPAWSGAATLRAAVETVRQGHGAPRTSLNAPIGASRRIGVLPIAMSEAMAIAHRHGAKLNDVFLTVLAGSLRRVLIHRGEPTQGVQIRASMAVSLYDPGNTAISGNHVGTMVVPLPLEGSDEIARLSRIAAAAAHAKATQRAVVTTKVMVLLARSGLTRLYIRRQHLINILTTNLPGPPFALYFAGARLASAVALPPIAGNVTVSFAALSYAGSFTLSVVADARAWPDLDVLMDGLRATWRELCDGGSLVPSVEGTTALSA